MRIKENIIPFSFGLSILNSCRPRWGVQGSNADIHEFAIVMEVYCQIHNYVIKSHVSVTINNDAVKRASSLKTKPNYFFKKFNSIKNKLFSMNVETLKKVLDKIPDDYEVMYIDRHINSTFSVDMDNEKLILE